MIQARYVVFSSIASNLFNVGNNEGRDIFTYDRDADGVNRIQRISVDKDDTSKEGNGDSYDPAISANGRYVVFESYASNLIDGDNNGKRDIFILFFSADGRYVVFASAASNLVDYNNKKNLVYFYCLFG